MSNLNDQEGQNKLNKRDTLTIIDNRTGKSYEIPITRGSVSATDLKKVKQDEINDPGLLVYDPGYMNTACCSSNICFIDGEKGILTYRGYNIEDLVEKSSFLEVAYLLIYGSLPTLKEWQTWEMKVLRHTFIHENLVQLMKNFRYDAHPMGMLISSIAAMGTFYPEANPALKGTALYKDVEVRNKQIFRILGKLPTIAACAYRHRIGRPYNNPLNGLSYTENFLYMLDRLSEIYYRPHPVLVRCLEKMWILHAEHELNCSTATMRQLASTLVDPYTAVAGAAAALYGPLHGGANEAVLRMLQSIGTADRIPAYLAECKNKTKRLFGFGHRVYKNYDPRAKLMKQIAEELFSLLGRNPLWDVALELERQALADEYFVSRRLYPNVDFYSGIIYNAMGFPTDMFPVLFTIPRVAGWLAHWLESLNSETRIFRPRQIYTGPEMRPFVPIEERDVTKQEDNLRSVSSTFATRRYLSEATTNVYPQTLTSGGASQSPPQSLVTWPLPIASSPHLLNESIVDFAIPKTIKTENRELLSRSPPAPPQTAQSPPHPPPPLFYNALGRPYL
jgi:citrate synthase